MKKLFMCCLSILLFISGCSSNSNTLTLKGDIQNNIVPTTTTVSGRIVEMKKNQGATVKKGDVIALIDNTAPKYTVDQMQAVVNMKKARLDELNAGTRSQQIEEASYEVSIAETAVNSSQKTYDYVNDQYNKTSQLYDSNSVSKSTLDDAKLKLETTADQLSSAKYKLESTKDQLKLLQEGSTSEAINAAQADLDQATAQLNQAKNTLNNCNIVALTDGIIISKNFELGDAVNIGNDIVDIAASDDLYVLCYIPDEYLDKVTYNQTLNVTTPTGTQSGTLNYIALKHEYTPKDKQSTSDNKHIATKIKISINDENGKLKSGMTAKVDIPIK